MKQPGKRLAATLFGSLAVCSVLSAGCGSSSNNGTIPFPESTATTSPVPSGSPGAPSVNASSPPVLSLSGSQVLSYVPAKIGQPLNVVNFLPGITVADPDTVALNGGVLTVAVTGPGARGVVLTVPAELSALGTVTQTPNALGSFTVTLNGSATPAALQAALQKVQFSADTSAADAAQRAVFGTYTATITLTDGQGGTSQPLVRPVDVRGANAVTLRVNASPAVEGANYPLVQSAANFIEDAPGDLRGSRIVVEEAYSFLELENVVVGRNGNSDQDDNLAGLSLTCPTSGKSVGPVRVDNATGNPPRSVETDERLATITINAPGVTVDGFRFVNPDIRYGVYTPPAGGATIITTDGVQTGGTIADKDNDGDNDGDGNEPEDYVLRAYTAITLGSTAQNATIVNNFISSIDPRERLIPVPFTVPVTTTAITTTGDNPGTQTTTAPLTVNPGPFGINHTEDYGSTWVYGEGANEAALSQDRIIGVSAPAGCTGLVLHDNNFAYLGCAVDVRGASTAARGIRMRIYANDFQNNYRSIRARFVQDGEITGNRFSGQTTISPTPTDDNRERAAHIMIEDAAGPWRIQGNRVDSSGQTSYSTTTLNGNIRITQVGATLPLEADPAFTPGSDTTPFTFFANNNFYVTDFGEQISNARVYDGDFIDAIPQTVDSGLVTDPFKP